MFGFDDAANMGLQAVNAGVQIYGANMAARQQAQLNAIGREQAARHYKRNIQNNRLSQEDTQRQNYFTQQDLMNNMGDQQGPGGSQEMYLKRIANDASNRRLEALMRQRDDLTSDWLDQKRMWDIQDKMAKTQQTMGMISSLLLQGGSGAAAFAGTPQGAG